METSENINGMVQRNVSLYYLLPSLENSEPYLKLIRCLLDCGYTHRTNNIEGCMITLGKIIAILIGPVHQEIKLSQNL